MSKFVIETAIRENYAFIMMIGMVFQHTGKTKVETLIS